MARNRSGSHQWIAAAMLAGVALTAPSLADAGCVWSDIVQDGAKAAIVKPGAARAYFVKGEGAGCPGESPACRQRAYLTAGDAVLTGPVQGAFTCAGFTPAKGAQTIGWLPTASLAALLEGEQKPADFAGEWVAPEQGLTITSAPDGKLSVKGDATWGDGDKWRRENGAIHTGEVSGTARPENGVLAFTMGETETLAYDKGDDVDCRIRMVRRGPYLLARDNGQCGGVNVSFSGFYRRKG